MHISYCDMPDVLLVLTASAPSKNSCHWVIKWYFLGMAHRGELLSLCPRSGPAAILDQNSRKCAGQEGYWKSGLFGLSVVDGVNRKGEYRQTAVIKIYA